MYDVIVVGARCAGSPTAMLLARKGYKVLLVDKATFPSDTLSTHILWPQGAELLDRWGLLDDLAATGLPAICKPLTFDVGPFALVGTTPGVNAGRGGYCPRRTVLDALLVKAGSGALTLGQPSSAGVPAETVTQTMVLRYNDVAALERAFEQDGQTIAAIMVDLLGVNTSVVSA